MLTLEELVAVGEKLQLTGKDLQAFIATQEEAQREECRLNREAERLEAERERQEAETTRERERQEAETTREREQHRYEQEAIEAAHRREIELLEVRSRLKVQDGEEEHRTRKKVMSLMKKVGDLIAQKQLLLSLTRNKFGQ